MSGHDKELARLRRIEEAARPISERIQEVWAKDEAGWLFSDEEVETLRAALEEK